MKYRPSPLNILAVVVTVKYLVLFIGEMQGGNEDLGGWMSHGIVLLLELFIPAFFLGMDYAIQQTLGIRKYFWVLLIELAIIAAIGLVLYYGYNMRTLYALAHISIFDMMKQ